MLTPIIRNLYSCNCIALQGDYVEKWYVKLFTVTSIKAVKCILPLLFDSPKYIRAVYLQEHFAQNRAIHEIMCENTIEPDSSKMTTQYGVCALNTVYLRLQLHTQNMKYLMFFHSNTVYYALQDRFIRVLHVFRIVVFFLLLRIPSETKQHCSLTPYSLLTVKCHKFSLLRRFIISVLLISKTRQNFALYSGLYDISTPQDSTGHNLENGDV